jgi:glycosyltransferase involved in cell wall biosynthesis
MKKICHLISSLLEGDGPSNGILAQVAAQDNGEFQSAIWSLYPPAPSRDPKEKVIQAGAEYKVFSMGASFMDLRVLVPLIGRLKEDRPDILHCHLVRANFYGRIAAKLARIPVVISTLRNIEAYMQETDVISRAVRQFDRLTSRWVSKYVAVSENVRQWAIKYLRLAPDQIITILNAIDLCPFLELSPERTAVRAELGLQPNDLVVGSVGRLHPQKNYPFFIKLAHSLSSRFNNARFIVIGDGEERKELEAQIVNLGLCGSVILAGFKPDIPRILKAFDIFILPSLYEGLPRAVMEAMTVGLPCIVTNVGGNAEAVVHGETGFVWPVGDMPNFVASLEQLMNYPELRQRMGQAGRERSLKVFTAERMAEQYADLYTTLLQQAIGHLAK